MKFDPHRAFLIMDAKTRLVFRVYIQDSRRGRGVMYMGAMDKRNHLQPVAIKKGVSVLVHESARTIRYTNTEAAEFKKWKDYLVAVPGGYLAIPDARTCLSEEEYDQINSVNACAFINHIWFLVNSPLPGETANLKLQGSVNSSNSSSSSSYSNADKTAYLTFKSNRNIYAGDALLASYGKSFATVLRKRNDLV